MAPPAQNLHRIRAKKQSYPANSLIIDSPNQCYLSVVQTDGPAPPGVQRQDPRCDMTFAALARQMERIAPAVLLMAMMGLVVGFATVGLA